MNKKQLTKLKPSSHINMHIPRKEWNILKSHGIQNLRLRWRVKDCLHDNKNQPRMPALTKSRQDSRRGAAREARKKITVFQTSGPTHRAPDTAAQSRTSPRRYRWAQATHTQTDSPTERTATGPTTGGDSAASAPFTTSLPSTVTTWHAPLTCISRFLLPTVSTANGQGYLTGFFHCSSYQKAWYMEGDQYLRSHRALRHPPTHTEALHKPAHRPITTQFSQAEVINPISCVTMVAPGPQAISQSWSNPNEFTL